MSFAVAGPYRGFAGKPVVKKKPKPRLLEPINDRLEKARRRLIGALDNGVNHGSFVCHEGLEVLCMKLVPSIHHSRDLGRTESQVAELLSVVLLRMLDDKQAHWDDRSKTLMLSPSLMRRQRRAHVDKHVRRGKKDGRWG